MATFGELLAELRQDHGLKQKELADILYVTPGTISNYENGIHLPDIEKLLLLADYFGTTTDYLLGRCPVNLSPEILGKPLLADESTGQFIQVVKNLTPKQKQALATIVHDMHICSSMLDEYNR